ncbi:MAG: hypothetical protein ACRD68_13920 [Pyrinomonadaceae bacterium]
MNPATLRFARAHLRRVPIAPGEQFLARLLLFDESGNLVLMIANDRGGGMSSNELKSFEDVYQLMARAHKSLAIFSQAVPSPALSQILAMQDAAVKKMTEALEHSRADAPAGEWPEFIAED